MIVACPRCIGGRMMALDLGEPLTCVNCGYVAGRPRVLDTSELVALELAVTPVPGLRRRRRPSTGGIKL